MTHISTSPEQNEIATSADRHTFQRDTYLKRALAEGKSETDEEVRNILARFERWQTDRAAQVIDPTWQENNLEYDLRSTPWILEKARGDSVYAQHLYAALCENVWQRADPWPILKNETWSCSWRHAGGIIADMLGRGDYIDWYCSGIADDADEVLSIEDNIAFEQIKTRMIKKAFVGEGFVTDEVKQDLCRLQWQLYLD